MHKTRHYRRSSLFPSPQVIGYIPRSVRVKRCKPRWYDVFFNPWYLSLLLIQALTMALVYLWCDSVMLALLIGLIVGRLRLRDGQLSWSFF